MTEAQMRAANALLARLHRARREYEINQFVLSRRRLLGQIGELETDCANLGLTLDPWDHDEPQRPEVA